MGVNTIATPLTSAAYNSSNRIFKQITSTDLLFNDTFEKYKMNDEVVDAIKQSFVGMSGGDTDLTRAQQKAYRNSAWEAYTAMFKANNFEVIPYVYRFDEVQLSSNNCHTFVHGPVGWPDVWPLGNIDTVNLENGDNSIQLTTYQPCLEGDKTSNAIRGNADVAYTFNTKIANNLPSGKLWDGMHISENKNGVVVLPTLSQLGNMQELNDNNIHFNDIKDLQKQLYLTTESYADRKVFNTLEKWQEKYSDYAWVKSFNTYGKKEDVSTDNPRELTGVLSDGTNVVYTGKSVFVFFVKTLCDWSTEGWPREQLWCFNIMNLLTQSGFGGTDGPQAGQYITDNFKDQWSDRFYMSLGSWGETVFLIGGYGIEANFIPFPYYMKNSTVSFFNKAIVASACEDSRKIGYDDKDRSNIPWQNGCTLMSNDPNEFIYFLNYGLGLAATANEEEALYKNEDDWASNIPLPSIDDDLGGQSGGAVGGNSDFSNVKESYDIIDGYSQNTGYSYLNGSWLLTQSNVVELQRALTDPDVWESLKGIFKNNPQDGIISLVKFPISFETITTINDEPVSILGTDISNLGGTQTLVGAKIPNNLKTRFELGTFEFKERFGNFLDYAPFTKITLYLPFVGFREIGVNDVMRRQIKIVYDIDYTDGSAKVIVLVSNEYDGGYTNYTPFYLYDAQIGQAIPLHVSDKQAKTQQALKNVVNAAVSIPANAVSGAVMGGGAGAALGALQGVGNLASSAVQSGADLLMNIPNYRAGGTISSQEAYAINNLLPFVIVEFPDTNIPAGLKDVNGFTTNIFTKLKNMKGITVCQNVKIDGVVATDSEKDEIKQLLESGVNIL
jgi:hypothetical protein